MKGWHFLRLPPLTGFDLDVIVFCLCAATSLVVLKLAVLKPLLTLLATVVLHAIFSMMADKPKENWEAVLENMLQTGDLQLECSDGSLLVQSQVLELASPEVLTGYIETAKAQARKDSSIVSEQSAVAEVPSIKVCALRHHVTD